MLGPVFLLLLAINVGIGVYFDAVQVSVAAFATEQGFAGLAAMMCVAGSAAAAALAGPVIDTLQARGGFGLAASAALTMTLLAACIS